MSNKILEEIRLEELYTCDNELNLYIEKIDKMINKVFDKILSKGCCSFWNLGYIWKLTQNASVYVYRQYVPEYGDDYRIRFIWKKGKRNIRKDYTLAIARPDDKDMFGFIKEIKNYENIKKH